jgi:hypothetical protein
VTGLGGHIEPLEVLPLELVALVVVLVLAVAPLSPPWIPQIALQPAAKASAASVDAPTRCRGSGITGSQGSSNAGRSASFMRRT